MSGPQIGIWAALTVAVVALVFFFWQVANARGYRSRGRRRAPTDGAQGPRSRRSDRRKLDRNERRLYAEAQKLLQAGKVAPAARILEQIHMPREAIQALEDHGMIHEAAKILMRMQRHNRAGVIYARHGMWENAAQCFRMANMPLEVAKCAREAGDYKMAAEYFEKAGRIAEAAACWEKAGELQHAAQLFSAAGERDKAMALYSRLAREAENLQALELSREEVTDIQNYLLEGHKDDALADVVVSRNRLAEVLRQLLSKGSVKQAADLYLRAANDIGPQLMAEVNYQDRSAETLAQVFLTVSQFHYAGMIFERMQDFHRAGDAFEKAEDFERSAYCYERAGAYDKAKLLKEKAKNAPKSPGRAFGSPFSLSQADDDEETAVFSVQSKTTEASERVEEPAIPAPRPRPVEPIRLREDQGQELPERTDTKARVPVPPAPPPPPSARKPQGLGRFALDVEDTTPETATETTEQRFESLPVTAQSEEPEESLPDIDPEKAADEPIELDDGRAAFHRAKFFEDLDFDQKNKLWAIGVTHEYEEDEIVLNYNDDPQGIYVIIKGSVSCYRESAGGEKYVDQMGESDTFGELWLLADQPTAVKFVASRNTKVRVIGREAFNDLLDKDGTVARKLYKRFTMRLLKRLLKPQNDRVKKQAS